MLPAAFRLLRWPPDTVWRATPRELAWALGAHAGPDAPDRARLAGLMSLFPDETGA